MDIRKLSAENLEDSNIPAEPFEIIGKLKPEFIGDAWTYSEELFEQSYWHSYPEDATDYSQYINDPNGAVFLAYSSETCVGKIVLKKDWNRYALVENISISNAYRGRGIGTALIRKAIEWAKSKELGGLALETQANNLLACRFYAKCGFVIGAVNTMLYKQLEKPWSEDTAVFWYYPF